MQNKEPFMLAKQWLINKNIANFFNITNNKQYLFEEI